MLGWQWLRGEFAWSWEGSHADLNWRSYRLKLTLAIFTCSAFSFSITSEHKLDNILPLKNVLITICGNVFKHNCCVSCWNVQCVFRWFCTCFCMCCRSLFRFTSNTCITADWPSSSLFQIEFRNSMPASSYQQQKLRVCEVCGAYLGIHDNDRRLADHFGGKLHLGFITIRTKLDELKVSAVGKRLDSAGMGQEQMKGDEAEAALVPVVLSRKGVPLFWALFLSSVVELWW